MALYDMVAYEGDDDYIFVSYSHEDSAIVLPIIQSLQSQGFRIWFDKGIEPGTEWPEYIAEHLDACSAFISFMSPNASTSNNCRQEIHRAGSKRKDTLVAYIEQVQLSPGMDMRLGPLQAVKRWKFDSDEMFVESIAAARILQICRGAKGPVAKSNPIAQQAHPSRNTNHWQEIREKNFPLATGKCEGKNYLLSKPFYGRKWLLERMGTWLDEGTGGKLCAIYGGPGTGKSACCVKWSFEESRTVAAFSFVHDRGARFTTATAMLQSLAFQLAVSLPDYGAKLDNMLQHTSVDSLSALELLDIAILDPLSYCHPNGSPKTYCIVIDGLDEVPTSERSAVTQAIRNLIQLSPAWLRVLVTSRPDSDIALAIPPDRSIEIDANDVDNIKDVEDYLVDALSEFISDEDELTDAASALAAKSGGVFLFSEAAIQTARRGGFDLSDEASYPDSLGSAFHSWFERAFPDDQEYRNRWRLPLGAIIAAPDPLPEIELERMLGIREADLLDLKQALGSILVIETDDYDEPVITFPHQYYRDWLESKDAGRYAILRRDSIRAMALACYEIAEIDPASLTPYETEHLFTLLRLAGLTRKLAECSRNRKLADRLTKVGDAHSYCISRDWRILTNRAETCLQEALAIYETIASETHDASDLKKYADALERLGDYFNYREARTCAHPEFFAKATSIRKNLAETSLNRQDWIDYANALYTFGTYLPDDEKAIKRFDSALEILERIADSTGGIADRRLLADSLEQVNHWISDPNVSLEYCARALVIRRSIVAETGNSSDRGNLAETLYAVGHLNHEVGAIERAMEHFEEAIGIQETLVLETQDIRQSRNLGSILERIFWTISGMSFRWEEPGSHRFSLWHDFRTEKIDPSEIATFSKKVLETRKDISSRTEELDDLRKTGETALGLGVFLRERAITHEDVERAKDYCREAIDHLKKIVAETDEVDDRRKLADALATMGRYASDDGNPSLARERYEQAKEIQEQLASETADSDDESNLARILSALGDLGYGHNDAIRAEKYYSKAIEIQRKLAENEGMHYHYRFAGISDYTNGYVHMLEDFGYHLRSASNLERASKCFSEALAIKESCADKDTAEDLEDIARTLCTLIDITRASGNETAANDFRDRTLEIMRIYETLTQETDSLYEQRVLARVLSSCALYAPSHGDAEIEFAFRAMALEVEREIVEETNDAFDLRSYANDLYLMGGAYNEQGDTAAARRYFEQSLTEREKLSAQTLEQQDRRALAETLTIIAFVGYSSTPTEQPDRRQTADYLSRAATIRRELATETNNLDDRRALSQALFRLSVYAVDRNEAKELAREALDLQSEIVDETNEPRDHAALVDVLYHLSLLESNSDESKTYLARIDRILRDSSCSEEIPQSSSVIQVLTSHGKPLNSHI